MRTPSFTIRLFLNFQYCNKEGGMSPDTSGKLLRESCINATRELSFAVSSFTLSHVTAAMGRRVALADAIMLSFRVTIDDHHDLDCCCPHLDSSLWIILIFIFVFRVIDRPSRSCIRTWNGTSRYILYVEFPKAWFSQ